MSSFEIPPPQRRPEDKGSTTPAGLPRRVPGSRSGVRTAFFGGTREQVAQVRSWCQRGTRMPAHRVFPVMLVVSELVTNALRHSASGGQCGRVKVEMEHLPGLIVRVAVSDDGPRPGRQITLPKLTPQGEELRTCGRGLYLVEELSRGWGWTGRSGGPLTVWANVDPYRDLTL